MKKILLTLVVLLNSISVLSQDVLMQNGMVSQCSGNFYDSGGSGANYSGNESFTLTICPENAGEQTQITFSIFNIQNNVDFMTIYNGTDNTFDEIGTFTGNTNPGNIIASFTEIDPGGMANPNGCLTIVFTSNASISGSGWEATISCYEPCQDIEAIIDSTVPALNSENIVQVCQGEQITFNGVGVFSNDGTGSTYDWDFGDGTIGTGETVSHTYNTQGIFETRLVITDTNPIGCSSINYESVFIHVSTNPNFSGTAAASSTICYGERIDIVGAAIGENFSIDCANGGVQANLGSNGGETYESSLELECFEGQTVTNATVIESICIIMEHTFIGDLEIIAISPSGQQVTLHNQTGGGLFLGNPIISDGTGAGTGWEYCFTMSGSSILSAGPTEQSGTPTTSPTVEAGNYLPVGNFNSFIGSTINGEWTLFIEDHLNIDDGTIFSWSLNFDESLLASDYSFTPVIISESWDSDSTIINVTGNVITVEPPTEGQYTYTYRVVDDFGCEYTEEVLLNVLPEITTAPANNLFICNPGAAPYTFDLTENDTVVTAADPNPSDLNVTYYETYTDTNGDGVNELSNPIPTPNSYNSSTVIGTPQTVYASVEYLSSGCNEVVPFTLNLSSQPTINSVSDIETCDDTSNDTIEAFDLETQTATVLGMQTATDYTVTYYTSITDAMNGNAADALVSPYSNTISNPQPIFVRVQLNGDSTCFNTTSNPSGEFNLVVIESPTVTLTSNTSICSGEDAIFTITGTTGDIIDYTINGSATQQATIDATGETIITETGVTTDQTIVLQLVTNPTTGCTTTLTDTETVTITPNPSFTIANPTSVCSGEDVIFTVTGSEDDVLDYTINGGTTQQVTIDATGETTITITAATLDQTLLLTSATNTTTGCNSTLTDTATVTIDANPTITSLTTNTSFCSGGNAQFTITGTTGNIIDYTINGGTTQQATIDATGEAIITETGVTTDQTIVLQLVTNPTTSCTTTLTDTATVTVIQNPTVTLTSNTSICSGEDAIFTITGTTGDIIDYTINGSATQQATIDATGETIITETGVTTDQTIVLQLVTNPTTGCTTTLTDTETVTITPNPSFTIANPTSVCSGEDVIFTVTGSEDDVLDYTINGGTTQQVTIDATGETTITITAATLDQTLLLTSATNTTTGCNSTLTDTATVTIDANPTITSLTTNTSFCSGGNAQFTITGTTGNIIDYTINGGTTQQATIDATGEAIITETGVTTDQTIVLQLVTNPTTSCTTTLTDTATVTVIQNPTVTLTSNTSICSGEDAIFTITGTTGDIIDYTINGSATQQATIDATGETIITETGVTTDQTIVLQLVTNPTTGCTTTLTDTEAIIVNPIPISVPPTPLQVCDDGTPDGFTAIDLSIKNQEITGNTPSYTVTYYEMLSQAESGMASNALAIPYTNTSNPQTLYVRVEDSATGCYSTTSLDIDVQDAPTANVNPTPLEYCDPDSDGNGEFILTDATIDIIGTTPGLEVTYHETEFNAENDIDALSSPYSNIVNYTQTVYARVESMTIATNCPTVVALQLIVNDTPQVTDPSPLEACDDDDDGFTIFNLTDKDSEILNTLDSNTTNDLDPLIYTVSYYLDPINAETGTNAILTPSNFTNTIQDAQTLSVRIDDTSNGCYTITSLDLIVNPLPVINPATLSLCDYDAPGDEAEVFTLEDASNQILSGQTGITLSYYTTQIGANTVDATVQVSSPYTNVSNPETIYVRAENDLTNCISITSITLRVEPLPSPVAMPALLEVCDDDNDGYNSFDLDSQSALITNGEPYLAISYYETEVDAQMATNALTSPYNNIVENTQTIFVRAEHVGQPPSIAATGCYTVVQLPLSVLPSPVVPLDIDDYTVCDDDNDGFNQFNFQQEINPQIYSNGQTEANFPISYHNSLADAESGNDPIINITNYTNTATTPQTIYIRLVSNANGCVTTGQFDINVALPPVLDASYDRELSQCDDLDANYQQANDGITSFDLTTEDAAIVNGNTSWIVSYYETQADAEANTNAISDPTAYSNTATDPVTGLPVPQTLHIRVTDQDTGCYAFTTVTLRVLPNPSPNAVSNLELCDDTNAGDMIETFDLTQNEAGIINGETGVTASYYTSQDDAIMGTNAIADPTQHSNEDPDNLGTGITPQTIYVRVTNGDDATGLNGTGCYSLESFDVIVNPLPTVTPVNDYILCELTTDMVGDFDLESMTPSILNGQDPSSFTVTYHETPTEAVAGANALSSPYTNTSNPQTIYVNITNTITSCDTAVLTFNIEVQEAAQANPDGLPIDYELCDDNMEFDNDTTNDSVTFDLTTQDAAVLDGQDPIHYTISYYENQADAEAQTNPITNPSTYNNTINPQTIIVRVDNNIPLSLSSFNIDLSALTQPLDVNGDGTNDTIDTDNDGVFDIININGETQDQSVDTDNDGFIDYIDLDGDGLGDLVDLNNDMVVDNDSSQCYATTSITLQANPIPAFTLDSDYHVCINTNGTEIINAPTIDTQLDDTLYTFVWQVDGNTIAGETQASIIPTQGGTYTAIATTITTGCSSSVDTIVEVSEPPVLSYELDTLAFADTHTITVTASTTTATNNISDYEFSLDGGSWETGTLNSDGTYSYTFTDVKPGTRDVTVRDALGCGENTIQVMIMDYPLYFTPNGDGYHDTWNIYAIANQLDAKIYIFDRFGKLLKQLSPAGDGWDGTYNGILMPTSDYWFTVEYTEPNDTSNSKKTFKAHFTLKR